MQQSAIATHTDSALKQYLLILIVISFLIRCFTLGSTNLLVEEAYYWNYAAHMDWSYLDHPPMVAFLIKISIFLFGTTEWAVRVPSFLCWGIATFFSYRLTQLITQKGLYAVFLMSILPFFFLQSWVMTPDQPLIAAWSCALYALYRACVLNQSRYWYVAGAALGLGMLSKYTIVLLGPSALLYVFITPKARFWLYRQEPYWAIAIACVCFSPVLYWNATHDWISFTFQSSRRFQEAYSFSTHQLLGLILLFLMPIGTLGLISLYRYKKSISIQIIRFLQIFTLVPLLFFSIFSMLHPVKFNWIGPAFLATVPWLTYEFNRYIKHWIATGIILLCAYVGMMFVITQGYPSTIHQLFFSKFIAWEELSREYMGIASRLEQKLHTTVHFMALDKYNIASELAFYQSKLNHAYPVYGSHLFGGDSLMYQYWSDEHDLQGKIFILVSDNVLHFNNPAIQEKATVKSPILFLNATSQGTKSVVKPYYYQIVELH